jgi:hypothetical protein
MSTTISSTYLADELDLANRIFLYYTEKMTNYQRIGSITYYQWYIDSLQVYCLVKFLEALTTYTDTDGTYWYIGNYEFSDNIILNIFYKIREYYLTEVDTTIVETAITVPSSLNPRPTGYVPDWKSFVITITTDVTTSISLVGYGFDYTLIDLDTVFITVNDTDPIEISTVEQEGCHLVGNTLYWHHYYDLNAGDRVYVKYKQIAGSL